MSSRPVALSSSSSSSSGNIKPTKTFRIHNGAEIYILRANRINSANQPPINALFRFSKNLFTPEAQAAMKTSSISNAMFWQDDVDYSIFDIDEVVDIINTSGGGCKAQQMSDLAFTKIWHCTPKAFLKKTEEDLRKTQGSVDLTQGQKTGFEKTTAPNVGLISMFVEPQEYRGSYEKWKPGIHDAMFDQGIRERHVEEKRERLERALVEVLGENPILPEEKVFTALRALAYRHVSLSMKKNSSNVKDLAAFYQLMDTVEFELRRYLAIGGSDAARLRKLHTVINDEITKFSPANSFFKKISLVVDRMSEVIGSINKEEKPGDYSPFIDKFLGGIINTPLKKQFYCYVSLETVRDVATENLALRSSLLLSQFKNKQELIDPQVIADLEKIDAAFRENDWVSANAFLCQIMDRDFFRALLTEVPGSFEDEKRFASYKFAAGVVNLVDFFNEVIRASSKYEWMNFTALNKSLDYLTKDQTALEKGQLVPLQTWSKALTEIGRPELGEQCRKLFKAFQQFDEAKAKFDKENQAKFSVWLQDVQKGKVDPNAYQELCRKIDNFCVETDRALAEIATEVQTLQALIVLLLEEKDLPQIDRNLLAGQLGHLNEKISAICLPFLSFVGNFKVLMAKEQTALRTYALPLFETDMSKLFIPHAPIELPGDDLEIRLEEEDIVAPPIEPSSAASFSSGSAEDALKEVFKNTKRRKIVENLSAFFKAQGQKVRVENGKGSHVKIYLGGVPIVIPFHKELKVGTAESIRDDILDKLRNFA